MDRKLTIKELTDFIFERREVILNQWRTAYAADSDFPQALILNRREFNNLIRLLLDALEAQLLGKTPTKYFQKTAAAYSLHHWQQAHDLPGLIRELNLMAETLAQQLPLFKELYPQTDPHLLLQAQFQIYQLMNQTVLSSVSKYDELQRLEVASRLNQLQQILEQTDQLSRQRGELLRASSHDLRSGFSIILSAVQLIDFQNNSSKDQLAYQQMLNRNLGNVSAMLSQLMDLARLETGQDPFQEEVVDAAQLLIELVDSAQALARERGLILRADGPGHLLVQTDRVKLYRIAQNLVVNALNYTPSGIVSVAWSAESEWCWNFSVQDSGPGLPSGLLKVLRQQLKPIVEPTSVLTTAEEQHPPAQSITSQLAPVPSIPTGHGEPGLAPREGVGLLIVKWLCKLIGASLEIASTKGHGTLFRIQLLTRPSHE